MIETHKIVELLKFRAMQGITELKKIDTMKTKKCKYNTGGLCQKKSGATFSLIYCNECCMQPVIKKIDTKYLNILNEVCDWIEAFGGLYIDYDEQGSELNTAKMIRDLRKHIVEIIK